MVEESSEVLPPATRKVGGLFIDSDLVEYLDALSGKGDRAYDWSDKPHRLVYDLVHLCQKARNANQYRSDWQNLEEFGRLID